MTFEPANGDWKIFDGTLRPHRRLTELAPAPPWRPFARDEKPKAPEDLDSNRFWTAESQGANFVVSNEMVLAVNSALYLRRPLLLTGKPGTGKSSLIDAVAYELQMGPVLRWAVTSRTTLRSGLYEYDALGRLNDTEKKDIGKYITLGPLGTALLDTEWPRALLIDEIDKSDLDLPNDLLHIFERGEFEIPEILRLPDTQKPVTVRTADRQTVLLKTGVVQCRQFPFVILTSNGEREFPAPFLRRCIRLNIPNPNSVSLRKIVERHLGHFPDGLREELDGIVAKFLELRGTGDLATDQLLNAIFLTLDLPNRSGEPKTFSEGEKKRLVENMLSHLTSPTVEQDNEPEPRAGAS